MNLWSIVDVGRRAAAASARRAIAADSDFFHYIARTLMAYYSVDTNRLFSHTYVISKAAGVVRSRRRGPAARRARRPTKAFVVKLQLRAIIIIITF